MQLVPHLDFDLIAEHPKAFSGYSDITALHVALRQRAGLATLYGPHLMTMGTPWEVELEGAILFLEEVDAPPWYVDGMLTQLGHAGKLAGSAGVAVGDMARCEWSEQRPEWPRTKSLEQVLGEHLEPLGVPVLYRLPIGHAKHLATLPLGVIATMDADARTLTVDQPALRPAAG
jgi:muramoyltetrapeptide carboxypeptidase